MKIPTSHLLWKTEYQLVVCPERLIVGRLRVQRIKLSQQGQFIIKTEQCILNFSLMFGEQVKVNDYTNACRQAGCRRSTAIGLLTTNLPNNIMDANTA